MAISVQDAHANCLSGLCPTAMIVGHRSLSLDSPAWALFIGWQNRQHRFCAPSRVKVALECEGVADLAVSVNRSARCSMFAWTSGVTITIRSSVFEVAGINVKVG